jgi:hypothetical protein
MHFAFADDRQMLKKIHNTEKNQTENGQQNCAKEENKNGITFY